MIQLRRVDRIAKQAGELKFGRAVLMTLSAPFYALGWLLGTLLRATWTLISWLLAATSVGFRDGRR